jgi:large conductance mechanosensitive channel
MSTLRNWGERGFRGGLETMGGFRKFILRGNVVDLAVGIVIGAAFSSVVTALVKDIITPLVPTNGKNSLSDIKIPLPYGTGILVGDFLNTILSFLILAAIIYFFVILPITKLQDRFMTHSEPEAPDKRECPFCLSNVPLRATRCAFCTAQLSPVEDPAPPAASKA